VPAVPWGEVGVMPDYTLSVVYPDGNPEEKASFGEDLQAAVEAMERRQALSDRRVAHWMVWDAENGDEGYFDRDRMDEMEVF
jgi:hypothetical protein